jgi:hypothetical protein
MNLAERLPQDQRLVLCQRPKEKTRSRFWITCDLHYVYSLGVMYAGQSCRWVVTLLRICFIWFCCTPQRKCIGRKIIVKRTATCRCGQLNATCEGEPVRVSVCHCLERQKRSGSAFATQARWPETQVAISGKSAVWERVADSGHTATYRFCPECGSTLAYVIEGWPGVIAIPVGAFADLHFPAPDFSVYEHRNFSWVEILGDDVEHSSDTNIAYTQGKLSDKK